MIQSLDINKLIKKFYDDNYITLYFDKNGKLIEDKNYKDYTIITNNNIDKFDKKLITQIKDELIIIKDTIYAEFSGNYCLKAFVKYQKSCTLLKDKLIDLISNMEQEDSNNNMEQEDSNNNVELSVPDLV